VPLRRGRRGNCDDATNGIMGRNKRLYSAKEESRPREDVDDPHLVSFLNDDDDDDDDEGPLASVGMIYGRSEGREREKEGTKVILNPVALTARRYWTLRR